jgi:hypothetical protein
MAGAALDRIDNLVATDTYRSAPRVANVLSDESNAEFHPEEAVSGRPMRES